MTAIRGLVWPLLAAVLPAGSAAAGGAGPERNAQRFVGSLACQECHPDMGAKFYKNPHYKSVASGKEPPEDTGCEGCHGPGITSKHGGAGTIVSFTKSPTKQVLDACLKCHSQTLSRANIRRSSHTLNDVVCTSCHSIHHAATPQRLLAKTQTTVRRLPRRRPRPILHAVQASRE